MVQEAQTQKNGERLDGVGKGPGFVVRQMWFQIQAQPFTVDVAMDKSLSKTVSDFSSVNWDKLAEFCEDEKWQEKPSVWLVLSAQLMLAAVNQVSRA